MIEKINKIKNNKFINILLMLGKIVSTFLIVLIVSVVFVQRLSNNKINLGGYSIFTVVSESMEPEYKVWDMIVAKEADPNSINVGDDIVYLGDEGEFAGRIVTHRVIKIDKNGSSLDFTTQGISNELADPVIDENQIYGKVLFKSTLLSFLSKLMNNLYGFYFLIFIPFVIILFFEILDIVNDRDVSKAKNKLKGDQ